VRRARHLPGIRFEALAPPLADVLPRMDVAIFVGFAASGPLQRPVPVEDIAQFSEIFGSDIALARTGVRGEISYGNLASAVRAFFRNGGRRCWIVRVAGNAISNRVPIPGLSQVEPDGTLSPAYAVARSEGSWSDTLRVSAALTSETLDLIAASLPDLTFDLALSSPDQIVIGDLLRLTYRPPGGDVAVLLVTVASLSPQKDQRPKYSGRLIRVTGRDPYWGSTSKPGQFSRDLPMSLLNLPLGFDFITPSAERLTFELRVTAAGTEVTRIDELGFSPDHPRYWAALPADAQLYREEAEVLNIKIDRAGPVDRRLFEAAGGGSFTQGQIPNMLYTGLWQSAVHPRFPLAGLNQGPLFLPTSMPFLPSDAVAPEVTAGTPLERDGLDHFAATLFLDPLLQQSGVTDLLNEADFIRYQSDSPRLLSGIHAALGIDEATVIAVPDAVHGGWSRPFFEPLGSPPDSLPLERPEWWHFLDCRSTDPLPRVAQPQRNHFLDCSIRVIERPTIRLAQAPDENGTFKLSWSAESASGISRVEEAVTPDFMAAEVVYEGTARTVSMYGRAAGVYYYRVREVQGTQSSDYSGSLEVSIEPDVQWVTNPVEEYDDRTLIDVHRSLLRMCAARGDLFAILSAPQHYRETDVLAHVTKLKSLDINLQLLPRVASLPGDSVTVPFTFGEVNAFSYGALYHPWLTGREENQVDVLRTSPPDGMAAGVMAQRSILRGAWIAPANEKLHGVVALTPPISPDFWQALQDAQINIVRQEPAGFMCLNSDTLSDDEDLRPVNVRRLLMLLRRAALKLGANYVFEPNDSAFQRSVQRGFEALLDGMFLRGAFAGRTSRDAFQVVVDSTLNTPRTMDQGRFIVELRVAPSLPLSFLTVRLLQAADRTFVTEGA
jgi:hypothetical protein